MQLLCGQCGQTVEVDDALAGGMFACPHCDHKIPVPYFAGLSDELDTPAPAPAQAEPAAAPTEPAAAPAEGSDEGGGFADMARQTISRRVKVVCGKCGKGLSLTYKYAGKRAKCPVCGNMIDIPYPDEQEEQELAALKHIEHEELEQLELVELAEAPAPSSEAAAATAPAAVGPAEGKPAMDAKTRLALRKLAKRKTYLVNVAIVAVVVGALAVVLGVPQIRNRIFGGGGPDQPLVENHAPPPENTAPSNIANTPKVVPPRLAVNSVTDDLFAANGYFPAAAGERYVKVNVTVTAGSERLVLESDGANVVLREGENTYRSLGLAADAFVVPVRSVRKPFYIDPQKTETMTLLFAVPVGKERATLTVGATEAKEVGLPVAPKDMPPSSLAGTFVEKPPRNLQPLLRDPVMAAVQSAVDQTLEIKQTGDTFVANIPGAGVSGSAKPLAGGVYLGELKAKGKSLECKLRLAQQGKLLIVYLSDEPFHQMTYERK